MYPCLDYFSIEKVLLVLAVEGVQSLLNTRYNCFSVDIHTRLRLAMHYNVKYQENENQC